MKTWFKILGGLMTAALITTVFVGATFAQGPVDESDGVRDLNGGEFGGRGRAYGFVDEDGDGINDRYLSDPEFVDQDGDGVCDTCGGVPGEGYNQEDSYGPKGGYGFAAIYAFARVVDNTCTHQVCDAVTEQFRVHAQMLF